MHITVNILAFRVVFRAIVLIHLIVAVQNTQFDRAPYVVIPSALWKIATEKSLSLAAVSAPFLSSARSFLLLDSSCYNLFALINKPDIDEPIDAADVSPYLFTLVFHLLEGALYARTEFTGDLVHQLIRVLKQISASRAIPVFFYVGCEFFTYKFTSIASLMHAHLAKPTDHYLILVEVV